MNPARHQPISLAPAECPLPVGLARAAVPRMFSLCLLLCLALLATAQDAPTANAAAFDSFRIIADRNIFNPNRSGQPAPQTDRPRSRSAPVESDSFTLVGTLGDNGHWTAFFDGSRAEFRGRLKLQDTIGDYVLHSITNTGVLLVNGTNELHLRVGSRMRRENNGPWLVAERQAPIPSNDTAARSDSSAANRSDTDADSEVLKRLMQQRERELQ